MNIVLYHPSKTNGGPAYHERTGVEFVRRVAALIPPPRKHMVRYYGALGPCSPLRSAVTSATKGKATSAELEAGYAVKSGLTFQMVPVNGQYEIWVGDESKPHDNFCMVLTGPSHGPNALEIEAWEVESEDAARETAAPSTDRVFKCLSKAGTYDDAYWALSRIIWAPPVGEPLDTVDKARVILDRYDKEGTDGHVSIRDLRFSKNSKGVSTIEHMKFDVEFFAPDAKK